MDTKTDAARTYTRRQFLEYSSIMNGAPWHLAKEAAASWAIENPDVEMDGDKLTFAEWEAERAKPSKPRKPGKAVVKR